MGDAEKKIKDVTSGYLAGLAGMPLATAPARPAAYLYGGCPLPLVSWDKKTHPYALMIYNKSAGQFWFYAYKSIYYYKTAFTGWHYFGGDTQRPVLMFSHTPSEEGWNQLDSANYLVNILVEKEYVGVHSDPVFWANFDLMYSDDTMYVGASDPEPITDVEPWRDLYFYNSFVDISLSDFTLPDEHARYIIKTETKYLFLDCVSALGGAKLYSHGNNIYIAQGEWDYVITAKSRDIDGGEWRLDSQRNYLGEEYEYNGRIYHYFCHRRDIIWSEDDITNLEDGKTVFPGTERVPVFYPYMENPPVVDIDNKAIMLGCRLGYIIRSQMGSGQVDIPDGVLISSDGYILCDCDGVYLIAMDEDADAVPEGALIASGGYILKDSNGRYLITRR